MHFLPAVLLWDFFDGDAHLVAQVSPCVHNSVSTPAENHPVAILIVVIFVLQNDPGINYHDSYKYHKKTKCEKFSLLGCLHHPPPPAQRHFLTRL